MINRSQITDQNLQGSAFATLWSGVRGPYCGAVGVISPDRIALNVAIRTIAMAREGADGGVLRYGAGCGIVAESEPRNEYEESLHKSAVLLRTAHMLGNGAGAGAAVSATGAVRAS